MRINRCKPGPSIREILSRLRGMTPSERARALRGPTCNQWIRGIKEKVSDGRDTENDSTALPVY